MRLAYMFLARYAEPNPDGTVTSHGGDFEFVRAETFPAVFPISLVAKLCDLPTEEGTQLAIALDIVAPSGKSLLEVPFKATLEPKKIPKGWNVTGGGTARIVFNLGPVQLPEPGRYEVRLQLGEGADATNAVAPLNAEVTNA